MDYDSEFEYGSEAENMETRRDFLKQAGVAASPFAVLQGGETAGNEVDRDYVLNDQNTTYNGTSTETPAENLETESDGAALALGLYVTSLAVISATASALRN